jgi:hypothetical protein
MQKRPGCEKYGIIGSILIWVNPDFFPESLIWIKNNPT